MKPALAFFLKIFLYMATCYGGMQLLSYYLFDGEWAFSRSFIPGFGFGLMMALFFTYRQIREVKNLHAGQLHANDFSMKQTVKLQTPLSKEQILEKLQNSYPSKDWELTEETDTIRLKTSFSWKSYGEKIIINVNQLQENLSEVMVESRPKFPLTLADYGKNQENIIYLKSLLAA